MKAIYEDTIAAPATVPGTGALTIIRLSGSETFSVIDKVFKFNKGNASEAKGYSVKFATVHSPSGEILDEVLISFFRKPHSYTGEDSAEISCHASRYICEQIMDLLCEAGARTAEPGEFTKRAFLNGKMDLSQAEAVADVISASGEIAHRLAFSQMKGGISSEISVLRAELLDIASMLELELDFSEEEVEFADREHLLELLDRLSAHLDALISSFRLGNSIKNGIPVAIAGAVNSGKSTFLNAIVGEQRALVSEIEGTTRDTIEEVVNIDGLLFRFIDTAGLRETSDIVENMGIERSLRKISEAAVVLVMLDSCLSEDRLHAQAQDILSKIDFKHQKALILLNKCDRSARNKNVIDNNKLVSSLDYQVEAIKISAKEAIGLEDVKKWLSDSQKDLIDASCGPVISNVRHLEAFREAGRAVARVRQSLADKLPTDLSARDLRDALDSLSAITGEISSEEILHTIFQRHCIGK